MNRFLSVNDDNELINLAHVMRMHVSGTDENAGTTFIMSDGSAHTVPEEFDDLAEVIGLFDKPPAKQVKNKHK